MDITERFLRYTQYDTQSAEDSDTVPSTAKQMVFARFLKDELKEVGLSDIRLDDQGYLYATLPANCKEDIPTIGFISHYDTSPDCSGAGIKPRVVSRYDGGDIVLSDGIVSSPQRFPELLRHVGEDLIVTDGHTLLGADDKAGIAEIVQAMAYLKSHPDIKHGTVRVAFNPDEEIGMGAHHFDVAHFGCEWAYTMDGGDVGELEYENFNAAAAKVVIDGVSVHPGYAKDKMVNASLLAVEFAGLLPADERPETTEDYQGFFHLTGIKSQTERAELSYIIRDHDRQRFEQRKSLISQLAADMDARYAALGCRVSCRVSDQYYNMREQIESHQHVVDLALRAMQELHISPVVKPIRGGTDGAQLSFKGLPCPNIFAGGLNFHGPYEFVSIQSMEKAMAVIVRICELTANFNK